jgi:methionyl-tRNA synthetase
MYVWFEALMNYITVLAYPNPADLKKFWPADVQIIGKDIIRFHAAIWPAMLMALGLDLPKGLYVHGFITLNNKRMSKSDGNVIAPKEIVETYGSDALRYYLLRHIPSYDDGDFSWEKMEHAYNGELGNGLGNLVQRLSTMIAKYQGGVIGEIPPGEHDTGPYTDALSEYRFDKALEYVFDDLIRGLNRYIDEEKPWEIAKKDSEHLQEVLAYSTGSLLQIASLLEPFMPRTAKAIQDVFKDGMARSLETSLFPRIEKYTAASNSNAD